MKAKENGHHARFRSVPIAFTIAALTFVPNPSAAEPTEPKTIAAQYAGGDKAALRWDHEASRSDESVCGYYLNDRGNYASSSEHAIFARPALGGDFLEVVSLGDTEHELWFGSIPGLSESTPLELQVRLKDPVTDTYCQLSPDTSVIVDTIDVEHQPTIDHMGDVEVAEFELMQ